MPRVVEGPFPVIIVNRPTDGEKRPRQRLYRMLNVVHMRFSELLVPLLEITLQTTTNNIGPIGLPPHDDAEPHGPMSNAWSQIFFGNIGKCICLA